ncbi:MAG TPA: response regulator transcription factor [Sporichthya sp.]|nr:response regulator transcription factor [Sporichthya sp.]
MVGLGDAEAAADPRVLVVEDDEAIGADLVAALAAAGYRVSWSRDAAGALTRASTGIDLVLLDLGLPDADGLDLCRDLRERDPGVLIVVLTARTDESDAVRALDAGADDYVPKPFRLGELLARLRAHFRRGPARDPGEMRMGALVLDCRSRRAQFADQELPLRPKEFELLELLVRNAGTAVRREQLMDEVWDENWSGSTKTLDVHVANLRRKLADAGDRWDRIGTLRGFGYRYDPD